MVVGTGSDLSIDLGLKVKRTSLLFISHCTLSFSLLLCSFSPLSSSSCYGCARNNKQHSHFSLRIRADYTHFLSRHSFLSFFFLPFRLFKQILHPSFYKSYNSPQLPSLQCSIGAANSILLHLKEDLRSWSTKPQVNDTPS